MIVNRNEMGAAALGLERLSKAAGDLWSTMDTIGAQLVSNTQERFETAVGPDGVAWKPSLRVLLEGGETMKDSGQLKASIAHRASRDSVEIGTNKIYAAVHQMGATINAKNVANLKFKIAGRWVSKPSVTIPARPFVGFDAKDQADTETIVAADLDAAVRGKPA